MGKKRTVFGILVRYVGFAFPITGFLVGKFLDDQETLRMTDFRDKSALYGGRVEECDPPTWPTSVLQDLTNLYNNVSKK